MLKKEKKFWDKNDKENDDRIFCQIDISCWVPML
jgi:hypothetical protein